MYTLGSISTLTRSFWESPVEHGKHEAGADRAPGEHLAEDDVLEFDP